jgi:ornithine cyclodeaminase/alanine dehydrogenase-like protein (mu-crystallin family)
VRDGTSEMVADLFELTRGEQTGRLPGDTTSITLFKSVGTALEGLAAAELAVEKT